MGKYNDLDLKDWQKYENISTDSLWIIKERYAKNGHTGGFHGNFVPQIPNQFLKRYTKQGDWVFDPFLGSGTTLIESRRLGRNGIGFEINPETAKLAQKNLDNAKQFLPVNCNEESIIVNTDSITADYNNIFAENRIKKVQLALLHPPYWDIIKFGSEENNLSNYQSLNSFLNALGIIFQKTYDVLESNRFMTLIIGDKYQNSEWIPLGFYCMQKAQEIGYKLKSIIVKNFDETKGKANQQSLWRYRALCNGFYLFKHEYIFLFQKK